MVDTQQALKEAQTEIEKEKVDDAKRQFKEKLRALDRAEKLVKNLGREIEDLKDELDQE